MEQRLPEEEPSKAKTPQPSNEESRPKQRLTPREHTPATRGVRSLSTPPGEPYNDIALRRHGV